MPTERLINDEYVRIFKSMSMKELVARRNTLLQKINFVPETSGSVRKALNEQVRDLDYWIQTLKNI